MSWRPFFEANGNPSREAILEQTLLLAAQWYQDPGFAQRVTDAMGGVRLLYWQWRRDSKLPAWALFADADANVLLLIEGTSQPQQWYAHVTGAFPYFDTESGMLVFWTHLFQARLLMEEVRPHLPLAINVFYISGHSYGGALATLLALSAGGSLGVTQPCRVMTLGAPRSVFGLRPFQPRGLLIRVVHRDLDPVPSLPPSSFLLVPGVNFAFKFAFTHTLNWTHVGNRVLLNDRGGLEIRGLEDGEPLSNIKYIPEAKFGGHLIEAYLNAIVAGF
jgi:pimeloyl-ACP methyl ester carboxylesterase